MPTVPRPRLLRTQLDRAGVRKMLTNEQDDALEMVARKIVAIIRPLYTDADGQEYLWKWKIERTGRRSTRAALLIYCDDETIRFKEAQKGLIARALRPMMIRGKVRIMTGSQGVKFK